MLMPSPSRDDEIQKQRRSHEGRQDTQRQLTGGHQPSDVIHRQQESRSKQGRRRDQPPVS